MKRMPAGVFKARCHAVIKLVQTTGEPVVVTKRGAPVVKVVPAEAYPCIGFPVRRHRHIRITLWEPAWLASHGRLEIPGTVEPYVEEVSSRLAIRPLTARGAVLANQLPPDYSTDPCDRLIGATALAEGIALVTKDSRIRNCKQLSTIW